MNQPNKAFEPTGTNSQARKFGMKDKIGYLLGDFGNDFFFIFAAAFLMVFYTDVMHLNPVSVGVMFLIARLWDAVADISWGRFIDTRKPGKNGKFKPWILRMSVPLVISGFIMFIHIPGMSNGFYLAYAYVTYILWGTLYSTVNIPYGSMASVISENPVDRTTLSSWRGLGATFAALIIGVGGPLVLFVHNQPSANRFILSALVVGILAIACYIGCYTLSIERITAEESQKPKLNLGQTFKGLSKNKPLFPFLIAALIFLIGFMLVGTVNTYLFKDYFADAKALSLVNLVQGVATIICMPFVKPLAAKFGKKELASVGLLLGAVIYFILYFLPNLSAIQFLSILSIGILGYYALFNLVIWAFVTDICDYHEYVTGVREDGTIYSFYSFARKIGQAVAGGIGGAALGAVGYNSDLKVQHQNTLNGIHTLGTLVPAIILFVVFVILTFWYPLNKKRTNQLTLDLAEKRKAQ